MIKDRPKQQHTPEQIRELSKQWYAAQYQREMDALALCHGRNWPNVREWLEEYVRADLKIRLRERLLARGWRPKNAR